MLPIKKEMYVFIAVFVLTCIFLVFDSIKCFFQRQWAKFEANHPLPAWTISNPRTAYRMACEAHKIACAAKNKKLSSQPSLANKEGDIDVVDVQTCNNKSKMDDFKAIHYSFRGVRYTCLTSKIEHSPAESVACEHLGSHENILYDVSVDDQDSVASIRPFLNTIASCFGPCVRPPCAELLSAYVEIVHPEVTTADVPLVIVKGTTQNYIVDFVLMETRQCE